MSPRIRALVQAAALASSAATCVCAPVKLGTESPFLPPGGGAVEGAKEQGPLEFRGVLSMGGTILFNVGPAGGGRASWLALNEQGPGFRVVEYSKSGDNDTVSVDYQGQNIRLELLKPRAGKAAMPAIPRQNSPAPGGPITPVVLNPTPADNARALEDTIAEVRRRRMLRQQAAAGGAQQGPVPSGPGGGAPVPAAGGMPAGAVPTPQLNPQQPPPGVPVTPPRPPKP